MAATAAITTTIMTIPAISAVEITGFVTVTVLTTVVGVAVVTVVVTVVTVGVVVVVVTGGLKDILWNSIVHAGVVCCSVPIQIEVSLTGQLMY